MSADDTSIGVIQRARELLGAAGTKTGQLARIARLEIDLLGIDHERRGALALLGEQAFDLLRRGEGARLDGDPTVVGITERIGELNGERLRHEREIEEIRESVRGGGLSTGGRP
jgi:hypothetical protein